MICEDCSGNRYAIRETGLGRGHAPRELQICDACKAHEDDDDTIAVLFVRELEQGRPHAWRCALELLAGRFEAHPSREEKR